MKRLDLVGLRSAPPRVQILHSCMKGYFAVDFGYWSASDFGQDKFMTDTDRGSVVLLGDFSNERVDLVPIARNFCWSVARTLNLPGLRDISRTNAVMAVLIHAGALGMPWREALRAVRTATPRACLILCHKAESVHARGQMVEAGAFGVLLSPLAHSEVRQLLGFVWASRPSKISPARIDARARRAGAA